MWSGSLADILFADDDHQSDFEQYDEDARRRTLLALDGETGPSSHLAFILGGFAMRKCQSFEGYTLCAKYNPSARQYRMSVEVGSGRLQKSEYEQSLHRIEQYAAQKLSDNVMSDRFDIDDDFEYDDNYDYDYDHDHDYDSEYDSEYDGDTGNLLQFANC